jgi:hypothetical protein
MTGKEYKTYQDPPKSLAAWAPLPASKAVHLVRLPKQHTFFGMKN